MKASEKMTAVYCRLALANDAEMEQQRELLVWYAQQAGYGDIHCYIDNGQSGLHHDRPGLTILEDDIRAGKVQRVLVRDVARISRDVVALHRWMEWVEAMDVKFLEVNRWENGKIHVHSLNGRCCLVLVRP